MRIFKLAAAVAAITALLRLAVQSAEPAPPLVLEAAIPLPGVSGRIDHLAVDLARKRLFIGELGNGSVDVVDLATRKVIHRITGLSEPQGVEYVPGADLIAVAGGGDGTVRIYCGTDFSARGVVLLGDDADDIHLDPRNGHLIVGYGDGGIAVIDPVKAVKLADIGLPAHPEGFQVSGQGRLFVNVPGARQITVADMATVKVLTIWKPQNLSSNFPMALDETGRAVAVVFRSPARLALYNADTGANLFTGETCSDADDIFFDPKRQRFYISCGAGVIDVFQRGKDVQYLGQVKTAWGARTSLFVPEMDRLFVAARAALLGSNASLLVYRPVQP